MPLSHLAVGTSPVERWVYGWCIYSPKSSSEISSYEIGLKVLAKLIVENKIDIKKICIKFNDTWDNFNNLVLDLMNLETKEEMLISFVELIKDKILIF